jgi:Fe-S cluster biogenesis protein NfuA/nitrite reductase/ring-hydroxylating ferredoxin subunit
LDDGATRDAVARAEELLEGLEQLDDPAARELANQALAAVLDLYGEGLERIISAVAERDDGTLAEALAEDELVSHLLFLHGLHPVPVADRVREALSEVRPYLESHGGDVELLGVENGVARLRLQGSCSGCPSSEMTLKLAIENAIHKLAPDLDEIETEGAVAAGPAPGLIQLEVHGPADGGERPSAPANGAGAAPVPLDGVWVTAGGMPELAGAGRAGPLVKRVSGEELLFLGLDRTVLAYRPACPACEASLADARLEGIELSCAECGNRYDVLRAGRCLDAPQLHLDPVPLLTDDDGLVKVALRARA